MEWCLWASRAWLVFLVHCLGPRCPLDYRDYLRWLFCSCDGLRCACLSTEMKPGSTEQCNFLFWSSPKYPPSWGQGHQPARGFFLANTFRPGSQEQFSGEAKPPATLPVLPLVRSYTQGHVPLQPDRPARPGKPIALTQAGGDSNNANIKWKSVLARQAFCFNKKVHLGTTQLWLYSATMTATSVTRKFILKYQTRNT